MSVVVAGLAIGVLGRNVPINVALHLLRAGSTTSCGLQEVARLVGIGAALVVPAVWLAGSYLAYVV